MPLPVLWSGSIFPGESTHERIGPAGTALISARPQWSGLFVFLVAAFEAIVLAGKIIPAAVSGLAAWREEKGADAANPPADLGRCLKRPVQLPLALDGFQVGGPIGPARPNRYPGIGLVSQCFI
jgi:hypothetical protein